MRRLFKRYFIYNSPRLFALLMQVHVNHNHVLGHRLWSHAHAFASDVQYSTVYEYCTPRLPLK